MKQFSCSICYDLYAEIEDQKPEPYYWLQNVKWSIGLDDSNIYFTPDDQEENRECFRHAIDKLGEEELRKRVVAGVLQTEKFDCSNCGGENCVSIVNS